MAVEQMELWSRIFLIVAILTFLLAIILFFALGIRKAFYIVTGRTVRRKNNGKNVEQKQMPRKTSTPVVRADESKKQKKENAVLKQEVRRVDRTENYTRVLDMNVREEDIWKGYENTSILSFAQSDSTTMLNTGGDVTTVLNTGGDATTMLNTGRDATTMLNTGGDATTVLNASGDATTVLGVGGGQKKLDMVVDIVLVHTDVAI